MIDSRVIIEFGTGSTAYIAGLEKDTDNGVMLMRSAEPGPIGRRPDDGLQELVISDPQVVMSFTNIEGIESFITNLIALKELMLEALKDKEKTTNDQN